MLDIIDDSLHGDSVRVWSRLDDDALAFLVVEGVLTEYDAQTARRIRERILDEDR
jgi:hypothetical protein